jgi:hypothetical protein
MLRTSGDTRSSSDSPSSDGPVMAGASVFLTVQPESATAAATGSQPRRLARRTRLRRSESFVRACVICIASAL